jgi:hypothetical protein
VLGSVFNSFAATIEIPTYDKTIFPITDPNGTMTIDYPDGVAVISVPYRNRTTSIDIAEYQKCMLNAEKIVNNTANLMGTNIRENSGSLKTIRWISVTSLIVRIDIHASSNNILS